MLSEIRVRELAVRWYFIALHCEATHDSGKAAPVFSKAHAFIMVLDLPSSISCGKLSDDGLKKYVKVLLEKWQIDSVGDETLSVGSWLTENVHIDFENHI
jgi:hypothetical protein